MTPISCPVRKHNQQHRRPGLYRGASFTFQVSLLLPINQLPLVTLFFDQLSDALQSINPKVRLTRCQNSGL
ncbi:MAG: hypothetical protein ACI892_001999, partial [Marinobacter maritimus]